jgi:hypothetical protein
MTRTEIVEPQRLEKHLVPNLPINIDGSLLEGGGQSKLPLQ